MEWLHRLRHFRYDETTTLPKRVSELSSSLKSKALVIVLSDLHAPDGVTALKLLAQAHDVVVLQMRDPVERELTGVGFFRGREAETGREFISHGSRHWLQQEVLEQQLKRAGIDHRLVSIEQPFAHSLRSFFESRDLLGRGAR
ncbi:MAG TPA: hypothetical protein DCY79_20980 [Planctomycetaceae bacterium]|nr:hypothetical protein [Planctomycetaceae bacterium]